MRSSINASLLGVNQLLKRLVDIALIAGGTIIILAMSANVASRVVLDNDIAWSTELIVFVMTWTVFLAGAAATHRGLHMRITEGLELLGSRRAAGEQVINIIVFCFLSLVVYYGMRMSMVMMDQYSSVLYYPLGLQYLGLPVASALSMCFLAEEILTGRWHDVTARNLPTGL